MSWHIVNPVSPTDLFALALVTKSSQTWQPCLRPFIMRGFAYGAGNVDSNVRSDVGGTVTWNASLLHAGMTSRTLYKAWPGGNSGFIPLGLATKRTVSRLCPVVSSPGFILDFLTVYLVKDLSVLVISSVSSAGITVHRYRDNDLGFTETSRSFQPCLPLRWLRTLESTLGQDPQPYQCGKSGPPDLRYSVDIRRG